MKLILMVIQGTLSIMPEKRDRSANTETEPGIKFNKRSGINKLF
jgi:hypothetical protein